MSPTLALLVTLLLALTASATDPVRASGAAGENRSSDTSGSTSPRPVAADRARNQAARGRIGPGVKGWRITKRNVGLAPYGLSCDQLQPYRGPARPPAGTRIRRKLVTVPLDLSEGDITISKSCIRPTETGGHNQFLVTTTTCGSSCYATRRGGVVIRDSEISGLGMPAEDIAGSCAFLGVADLYRNLMHGMGSGICYFETGHKHSAVAEQNYVTDLRSFGESHNEAATVRDFRDDENPDRTLVLRNNRLDCSSGNVTAGLFIQPTWVSIYHLDVIGNYVEGEGYNLYVSGPIPGEPGTYDDMRAINNRFRSTGWGPSVVDWGDGWDAWRDNYLYNPDREGGRGKSVRP